MSQHYQAGGLSYSADEIQKRREYSNRLYDLIDDWGRDYKIVIKQINEPAEPEAFYWHLYYKGTKINGGLVEEGINEAEHRAEMYRLSYTREIVLAAHVWDVETATWILKEDLNYG